VGPLKKSGAYDEEKAMEDNFIRPDKMEESSSKKK
jgi:hypothetical protein